MATNQDSIGLFMKSDSDGITDGQNNALALGIKTTPEHIKEFTNWDNTITSLNAVQKARFDDIQPDLFELSCGWILCKNFSGIYWIFTLFKNIKLRMDNLKSIMKF